MTRRSAFAEVQAAYGRAEHDEVLRLTGAMLAERPGDDAAHELRARSLLAMGRAEEAEREVADAVRLDPDEVRYRELLAEILEARGAHRDAAVEYGALARSMPAQAHWTVSEARERLGAAQPEMGVDAARRALRLDPADPAAHLALARGLVRTGDAAGAVRAAARSAELNPGEPESREVLADARWLAGDRRAALAEFAALADEARGSDRNRITRKARSLYRQHAGLAGRALLGVPGLFTLALRRGWLHAR